VKLLDKIAVLIVLALFFGCISFLGENAPIQPEPTPECRTIIVSEPYAAQECQNVSLMEEVCQTRELNYTLSDVQKTYLCTEEGLCVDYYPNGSCAIYYCSKGMTRCNINLTNDDPQKTGDWSVSANFTVDGATFGKNPVMKTLLPGESANFNFEQFYVMDINQKKADCEVFVSSPSKIRDCSFVTKISEQCTNITKYKDTEKEVCQ